MPPAPKDPVAAARKRVDELNATHYRLLKQRDEITTAMRENSVDLASALDELSLTEQSAAVQLRADLSGEANPADPPATTVSTGQASDTSKAGGHG